MMATQLTQLCAEVILETPAKQGVIVAALLAEMCGRGSRGVLHEIGNTTTATSTVLRLRSRISFRQASQGQPSMRQRPLGDIRKNFGVCIPVATKVQGGVVCFKRYEASCFARGCLQPH